MKRQIGMPNRVHLLGVAAFIQQWPETMQKVMTHLNTDYADEYGRFATQIILISDPYLSA